MLALDEQAQDLLFRTARTASKFAPDTVVRGDAAGSRVYAISLRAVDSRSRRRAAAAQIPALQPAVQPPSITMSEPVAPTPEMLPFACPSHEGTPARALSHPSGWNASEPSGEGPSGDIARVRVARGEHLRACAVHVRCGC